MNPRKRRSNSGPRAASSWAIWSGVSMPGISIGCSMPGITWPRGSAGGSISPHAAYRTVLKLRGPRLEAQDAWCVMNHLREDQVGHFGFEIPVDDRERSEVERSVRKHRDPDAAGDREDCAAAPRVDRPRGSRPYWPYYCCSRIGVPGQVLGTMRAPPIPVRASVGSIRSMPECALKNPILGHSFTK